ncbi:hypothetical protein BT69DRAFT_1281727 [Atractiella rhizophila]|nr:hypothetical protein BT69DRAFT_1281727 [Atractiella rhizophila]
MARFAFLATILFFAASTEARKHTIRTAGSLRSTNLDLTKRFPEPAFAQPVEVGVVEPRDIEEADWENKRDFVDAFDAADEFAKLLERHELEFEEEESLTKRATLVKVSVPGTVKGKKTGIASWFRASNKADSTNGKSWCGIEYKDNMMGFAINMNLMSKQHPTYYSNEKLWRATAKKFCGLEAEVSYKGKKVKMYVMDAFDPAWVRTTYSIDVLKGAFEKLFKKKVSSKNTVMQGAAWKMTGRRNKKYGFQG